MTSMALTGSRKGVAKVRSTAASVLLWQFGRVGAKFMSSVCMNVCVHECVCECESVLGVEKTL